MALVGAPVQGEAGRSHIAILAVDGAGPSWRPSPLRLGVSSITTHYRSHSVSEARQTRRRQGDAAGQQPAHTEPRHGEAGGNTGNEVARTGREEQQTERLGRHAEFGADRRPADTDESVRKPETDATQRSDASDEDQAIETAVRLLRRIGLAHRALAFPEQMSGGEQQRVAIARALALEPAVLLFDEPTSALDPESTGEVLRVMRRLADDGATMMIVTHEVPFAREISDWIVFLDRGRVVEAGEPTEVIDRPRQVRTKAFLAAYGSDR